jgi:succinoglycan biosynthesis protein ExoM
VSSRRVDVCIATYQRPERLRRLLASLRAQRLDTATTLHVCVADNDAAGSARDVVSASGLDTAYCVQPVKNISLTRNAALALGDAEIVLIVDDDELVPSNWVRAHLDALERWDADVSHGPVFPVYAATTSEWFSRLRLFDPPDLESGTTAGYSYFSGNCAIRRAVLAQLDPVFDPRFGLSGGEDTEMFARLAALRTRFVWCREAFILELVPPERASLGWILRRRYRIGTTWTRRMLMHDRTGLTRRLPRQLVGLVADVVTLAPAAAIAPVSTRPIRHRVRNIPFQIGALLALAGLRYDEYT